MVKIIRTIILVTIVGGSRSLAFSECMGEEQCPAQSFAISGTPLLYDETQALYRQYGKPAPILKRTLKDLGRLDAFETYGGDSFISKLTKIVVV